MASTLRWAVAAFLAPFMTLLCCCIGWSAPAASDAETSGSAQAGEFTQKVAAAQIPLDKLDEGLRGKVDKLLRQPALYSRSPSRAFPCRPAVYHWLLDNPHLAARAWQGLGAKCATIEKQAEGVFTGSDALGGKVRWQAVAHETGWRAWYAEGVGRPAPFAPALTLRALVILNYQEVRGADGRLGIRHHIEVLSQLEGRTSGWLSKLGGNAIDQSTRKMLEQVELFFSGMAWYLSTNPGSARKLLTAPSMERPEESQQVEIILRELAAR